MRNLPASFHFAATSILTPCPVAAAAETDASTDCNQRTIFCEKYHQRWRIVRNLLANLRTLVRSRTESSLPHHRLDLPSTLHHTMSRRSCSGDGCIHRLQSKCNNITDGGALCAISWQIGGLPASFHFAATSILTPCPGAAAAETDASTDCNQSA